MARIRQRTSLLAAIGLAVFLACDRLAIAQSSAESATQTDASSDASSDTGAVEGPLLLSPNDPPTAGVDTELPEPVRGPLPGVNSAVPRPVDAAPPAETPQQAPAATDALPPPRQLPSVPEQPAPDFEPVLGLTLEESVRGEVSVRAVEPQSAAARAGLERGDLVLAINGERVRSVKDARQIVAAMQPGEVLDIDFSRDLRTQLVLEDRAVRTAGYAEDRAVGAYDGAAYRPETYRGGARLGTTAEDLPLPAGSEARSRRSAFFYAPDASDSPVRYETEVIRRPQPEADRQTYGRERDDRDRRFRSRPLLPWRRN